MMIQSNGVPAEGFNANNQIINLTSASNFKGEQSNDAAFVVLQKKFVMAPKIIKPGQSYWI